jgi:ribonuclease HII
MPTRALPDLTLEDDARARGAVRIAGVDEVGRGPLAGPVVAAGVILDPARVPAGLDDSKRLTPARREALAAELHRLAEVSVAQASVAEIDSLGIWGATALAMGRVLAPLRADFALVDGDRLPEGLGCPASAVVRGDGRSASIAAASVVAKVMRDGLMTALAQQDPRYGWERNKGYPTAAHHAALRHHGVTQHHRRSFRPVHQILCPDGETDGCAEIPVDPPRGPEPS